MIRAITLIAVLLCPAVASAQPEGGPPPAKVRLDTAVSQEVTIMRSVTGDLRAVRRSMVAAEEEGRVVSLLIEVGDSVEKDQVLATLDATIARLDVTRLEAEASSKEAMLSERNALLRQAKRDVTRLEEAKSKGSVFNTEIQDAEIRVDGAEARVRAAEADLASANAQLARAKAIVDDLTIRAPFKGQVITKMTEVGDWVDRGGTVVELVALDTIDAYVNVPERFVPGMAEPGASVEIQVPALDRQFASTDVTVIASGDDLARTFPVRVRFENPGALLKPGMSVRALVPTSAIENAITIHKDAVLRDDGGAFAYFDAGGMAMPMRFDVRWGIGERVVVSASRIQAGMRFIIEGNERLYPTAPIADMDAPATGAPQANSPQNTDAQPAG